MAFIVVLPFVSAADDCRVIPESNSCNAGETEIAKLVDATGGHLAFTSGSTYQHKLCCTEAGSDVWFGHTDSGDGQGHLCMGSSCPDAIATGYDSCRIADKSLASADEACVVGVTASGHVSDCLWHR